MKQTINWMACILLFNILAYSCTTSSDDDQLLTSNDITQTITQTDGWKVSWYWDKDKDETSDFSGYIFYFKNTGVFEALKNGSTISGTWQIKDDSHGTKRLVINPGNEEKPLSELEDDWVILEMMDNKIELKDDNDEHLEELYFEKI